MGIFDKVTISFGKQATAEKKKHTPQHSPAASSKQPDKAALPIASKPISFGMDLQSNVRKETAAKSAARSAANPDDAAIVRQNEDGSCIIQDSKGTITKTIDVLGVKREFLRDRYTGELMTKRFGLWTKPQSAVLEEDGTFAYTADGVDIVERLDGTHLHRHHDTNTTIMTDQVNKVEIVKNPDGETTKRQITSDGETFGIWCNGEMSFHSETFYQPRRHEALTPNGTQPLVYVSRAERRILAPNVMQEKFFFRNPNKNERQVTLSLQFGSGLLMLKNVLTVSSLIHGDVATETTFELKHPVTLRVDLPGFRGAIERVTNVRLVDRAHQVGVAFTDSDQKEQMVLIAKGAATFPHTSSDASVIEPNHNYAHAQAN